MLTHKTYYHIDPVVVNSRRNRLLQKPNVSAVTEVMGELLYNTTYFRKVEWDEIEADDDGPKFGLLMEHGDPDELEALVGTIGDDGYTNADTSTEIRRREWRKSQKKLG